MDLYDFLPKGTKPEPIVLDWETVKAKGRAAFLAGELACQDPDLDARQCRYRTINDRPCIIGASLTDEQAQMCDRAFAMEIASCDTLFSLAEENILKLSGEDRTAFGDLQKVHDWACSSKQSYLNLAEVLDIPEELIPERVEIT